MRVSKKLQKIFHEVNVNGIEFFNEDGKILHTYRGGFVPTPASLVGGTYKNKDWNKEFVEENGVTARDLCAIIHAVLPRRKDFRTREEARIFCRANGIPPKEIKNTVGESVHMPLGMPWYVILSNQPHRLLNF